MITIKEIAWLAGILEGEGHFETLNRGSSYPRINLAMTDLDVVIRVAEITGADTVRLKPNAAGVKLQYQTRIYGAKAIQWCMTLYPLMSERRKQRIREILAAWRAATSGRRSYKRHILNGPHDARIIWQRIGSSSENLAKSVRALAGKLSQQKIAEKFGINQATVWRFIHGAAIN